MTKDYEAWKARAVVALKESIEHWERLRKASQDEDEEPTADDCACCIEFEYLTLDECNSCPIRLRTSLNGCWGTPYRDASTDWYDWRDGGSMGAAPMSVQRMLDYLRETLAMVERGEVKP